MTELDATWGRTLRVWWAYLWRNLLVVLTASIAGFLFWFALAFILIGAGVPSTTVSAIAMPFSLAIGLALSVIPFKLILGKGFGDFKLALVSLPGNAPAPRASPAWEASYHQDGPATADIPVTEPRSVTRRSPATFGKRL